MKIKYRPEIDGLRAIAVLAVIFYHAEFNIFGTRFMKGGFYGVDIFFVISGYLITSVILNEIKTKGTFSFLNFYERRARRLLPVLFLVIIISIPFGWLILYSQSIINFSESIISSLFFVSNYFFYHKSFDYSNNLTQLVPFLHTWSLSIEEQFYLIFPIFLIYIYKIKKNIIGFILFLILLISINYLNTNFNEINNSIFYLTYARIWEILSGCILALYKNNNFNNKNLLGKLISLFGLLLIIISIFLLDDNYAFPSIFTLIPVIGTALLIWFYNDYSILSFLTNKILVYIGLISYSLYIWHFPIFALTKSYNFEISSAGIVLCIFLSFLLSSLSYFFIEKPFRNKKTVNTKLFITITSSLFVLILTLCIYSIYKKGFKNDFNNNFFDNAKHNTEWNQNRKINFQPKFKEENKPKILIIGNSHGRDTYKMLKNSDGYNKIYEFTLMELELENFVKHIKLSKLASDGKTDELFQTVEKLPDNKWAYLKKDYLNNKAKQLKISEKNFKTADIIILATSWSKNDYNELPKIVKFIRKNNKQVFAILQRPQFYMKIHPNPKTLLDTIIEKNKDILSPLAPRIIKEAEKQYFQVNKNFDTDEWNFIILKSLSKLSVKYLNPKHYSCNALNISCDVITDKNKKIYWDHSHYTNNGAKFFGRKIFEIKWFDLK